MTEHCDQLLLAYLSEEATLAGMQQAVSVQENVAMNAMMAWMECEMSGGEMLVSSGESAVTRAAIAVTAGKFLQARPIAIACRYSPRVVAAAICDRCKDEEEIKMMFREWMAGVLSQCRGIAGG